MKLNTFLNNKYNGKNLAFSNRTFIEKVFYPNWQEYGLDLIHPEIPFLTSGRSNNYYIDFIIETNYSFYLIEIDDYGSHAGNREYFEKHQEKVNNISLNDVKKVLEKLYENKNYVLGELLN